MIAPPQPDLTARPKWYLLTPWRETFHTLTRKPKNVSREAGEWKAGWPVIAVGTLGTLATTFFAGVIGVDFKPLSRAMNRPRAEVTASIFFAIVGVSSGIADELM